jgi:hypothetical protein
MKHGFQSINKIFFPETWPKKVLFLKILDYFVSLLSHSGPVGL